MPRRASDKQASRMAVAIGKRLRRLRQQTDWTTTDVAQRAKVSQTHICDIENGRKKVSAEMLYALCRVYHVPVESILKP